ncbi:MAG TPA: anti-sigma factor [Acidobacteriota bacterium]
MSHSFIHKIFKAEIPPPESAWDNIAAELEKAEGGNIAGKMATASIDPPTNVWDRIAAELDGTTSRARPTLIAPWLKWTAAAMLAGLLIFSANYIFRSGQGSPQVAEKKSTPSNNESNTSIEKQSTGNGNANVSNSNSSPGFNSIVATNSNEAENNRKSLSLKKVPPVRYAMVEPAAAETNTQQQSPDAKINANVSTESANYIPAPDYFVVTAPNGERVKISSKFSDAVTALLGGDNIDYHWKSRFDSWKAKLISNPSFIPAAGNFLDIAELKDLIKEQ